MTTHPHLRVFSAVIAEGLSKNFDSDDHFARPFLFMGVKGKPKRQKSVQQQLEQKTMTALHIGKSIYRSPLRRGLLLIILPALRRPLFHTSEQLAIRPIFLLLSTAAALLGAPLATQGTPVNFVITGSLATARYFHTATLLPNGKVLVAGGDGNGPSQESAELYDPASGTWTATGSLSPGTSEHTATLLPNGKVLVAGGVNGDTFEFGSILANAELYH